MPGARVTTADHEGVVVLTLDHPPVNALDLELLEALVDEIEGIASALPPALVIAGRGRCFSAGVDLKALPAYASDEQRRMVAAINSMVVTTYGLPCPVVAAITGHAIAGGFVLALGADYRVASSDGRYGLTEVRVGVPYPAAAIGIVRAELEPGAARMLALRGQLTTASRCVALGAFDEAVPYGEVLQGALEVAKDLAGLPVEVYRAAKGGLRTNTIAEMRAAIDVDPLLSSWVSS